MLRRSDFIAATYALSLVLANFGIAIAARMPMMTTTIRSSIRVKPLRSVLFISVLQRDEGSGAEGWDGVRFWPVARQRADHSGSAESTSFSTTAYGQCDGGYTRILAECFAR